MRLRLHAGQLVPGAFEVGDDFVHLEVRRPTTARIAAVTNAQWEPIHFSWLSGRAGSGQGPDDHPRPAHVQRVFEVAGLLEVLPFEEPAVS
jgi:hypothetical protein